MIKILKTIAIILSVRERVPPLIFSYSHILPQLDNILDKEVMKYLSELGIPSISTLHRLEKEQRGVAANAITVKR